MANHPTMASVARASPTDADFDALYRMHAPRVRALAYHRLRDSGQADDVVQETFLRAYRALDRLDPQRPAWPWLRTIADHICTDIVRRSGVVSETPVADDTRDAHCPSDADPSAEAYLSAQQRAGIKDALGRVHPRQRRMLVLHAVEGLSPGAVAEAEGMSVTAARAALKRGRKSFRRHYMALAAQRGLLGLLGAALTRARFEAVRAQRLAVRFVGGGIEVALPAGFVSVALAVSAASGIGMGDVRGDEVHTSGGRPATAAPAGAPEGAPAAPAAPAAAGTAEDDGDGPTTSWGKSIGTAPGPVGVEAQAGVEKDGDRRKIGAELRQRLPVGDPGGGVDQSIPCTGSTVGALACTAIDALPKS